MSQNIKKIIAQEYIKCAKDPAYFMRKYCYIQHPTRGRILFNLYPFQDKILHIFRDNDYIITNDERDDVKKQYLQLAFNLDKKISQNSLHNNRRISQRHAKLN